MTPTGQKEKHLPKLRQENTGFPLKLPIESCPNNKSSYISYQNYQNYKNNYDRQLREIIR